MIDSLNKKYVYAKQNSLEAVKKVQTTKVQATGNANVRTSK